MLLVLFSMAREVISQRCHVFTLVRASAWACGVEGSKDSAVCQGRAVHLAADALPSHPVVSFLGRLSSTILSAIGVPQRGRLFLVIWSPFSLEWPWPHPPSLRSSTQPAQNVRCLSRSCPKFHRGSLFLAVLCASLGSMLHRLGAYSDCI